MPRTKSSISDCTGMEQKRLRNGMYTGTSRSPAKQENSEFAAEHHRVHVAKADVCRSRHTSIVRHRSQLIHSAWLLVASTNLGPAHKDTFAGYLISALRNSQPTSQKLAAGRWLCKHFSDRGLRRLPVSSLPAPCEMPDTDKPSCRHRAEDHLLRLSKHLAINRFSRANRPSSIGWQNSQRGPQNSRSES